MNRDRRISRLALVALLCMCSAYSWGRSDPASIVIGKKFQLSSKILNEERTIWIYTPPNYQTAVKSYPVIYLLDGDTHFHYVVGIVEHLSSIGRIPQMIVVAVPNTNRLRDFTPIHSLVNGIGQIDIAYDATGGGDNFLKFLSDELIPYVDKNYRTQPYRILEGHSLGGMFATYVLETAPALFNSYVIISAAFYGGNIAVLESFGRFLSHHPELHKSVHVSIGEEPGLRRGVDSLVHQLKDHAPTSVRWGFHEYKNEDHMSVPLLSMYDGLRFAYSNWWIDLNDTTKVPTFDALKAHFESISEDLGYEVPPAEDIVNTFGYVLLFNRRKVDDAIMVFKENVKNYPASFNVYDSLGEGYMVKGENDLAITNYEKSIQLNPNNNNGKRMLAKLRAPAK